MDKFEIYKKQKQLRRRLRKFSLFSETRIPLGYVIKPRNEQQGSWINLNHEEEPDNSSWVNGIGM